MLLLPDKVKQTVDRLRVEFKFYVSLKKINGKYYAYKQTTIWNKEVKKLKVISEYLGRITDDGSFIKKTTSSKDELEKAKELIVAHGGKIFLPEKKEIEQVDTTYDETERKILRILSMNARANLKFISGKIGLSSSATYTRIKNMRKKYDVKYFAEVDIQKLGYLWYSFAVKFDEFKPSLEKTIQGLEKFPEVQLAFFTKGGYDLIIFFLVENYDAADALAYKIMTLEVFSENSSTWNIVPVEKTYGSIPLREAFFERLREKIYKRSKDNPRKGFQQIYEREFLVLKELSADGSLDFSEIDKKYNFESGKSRYTYHDLIKKGIIERITISLQALKNRRLDIIFIELKNARQFFDTRADFLHMIADDSDTIVNRNALVVDIGTPAGVMLVRPVFDEGSTLEIEEFLRKNTKGMRIRDAIISNLIIGDFCYRRYDNSYSMQHKLLVKDYGMIQRNPVETYQAPKLD